MGHICFCAISKSNVNLTDEEIDSIFCINESIIDSLDREDPRHPWNKEVDDFFADIGFRKDGGNCWLFDADAARKYISSGIEDDWIYIVDPVVGLEAMTPDDWLDRLVRCTNTGERLFLGTIMDAHV